MDDPFLVGMLDALADRHEELQPLADRQPVCIAVLRDLHTLDVLHDEIGAPGLRRTSVDDAGNAGMLHEGERLTLRLETGDELLRVHAELDEFQRDRPLDRLFLLGLPHLSHASLAERV